MDTMTPEQRHRVMVANKSKDTKPEILVRKLLHGLGYRFRLCRKDLPGKPDIVLPKYRTVIFVHGCFWHQHAGCKAASRPSTNVEFWEKKFARNRERDARVEAELAALGWRVIVIWECEVKRVLATRIIPGLNDVDETEEEEGLLMAAENDGD